MMSWSNWFINHMFQEYENGLDQMAPDIYDVQTCVQLASQLSRDHRRLHNWLTNLNAYPSRYVNPLNAG